MITVSVTTLIGIVLISAGVLWVLSSGTSDFDFTIILRFAVLIIFIAIWGGIFWW